MAWWNVKSFALAERISYLAGAVVRLAATTADSEDTTKSKEEVSFYAKQLAEWIVENPDFAAVAAQVPEGKAAYAQAVSEVAKWTEDPAASIKAKGLATLQRLKDLAEAYSFHFASIKDHAQLGDYALIVLLFGPKVFTKTGAGAAALAVGLGSLTQNDADRAKKWAFEKYAAVAKAAKGFAMDTLIAAVITALLVRAINTRSD